MKGMEKTNQKEMNGENKREVEGNKQKKGNKVGGEGYSEEEQGISILHYLHIVKLQSVSNMRFLQSEKDIKLH
jgi:hypothetical protein